MTESGNYADTPLMRQYYSFKSKHPDAILLFRVGDFYETFGEDAIKTSEILGITLTRRANGAASFVELAGFPHHAIETYLHKLVRAGQRVAVCEQLEDPKLTKKIVKRGITEMITPGITYNDNVLERKENNFIACLHFEKTLTGIAFLDISTGEFLVAQGTNEYVDKLLSNFQPKEVLFEKSKTKDFVDNFGNKFYTYKLDDWVFQYDNCHDKLLKHFNTTSLKGFGIHEITAGVVSAGAILQYLELNEQNQISQITSISRIEEEKYMWLDKFTIRNLELVRSMNEDGKSLLDVIDKTLSPMGARMLRRWLMLPLKDVDSINRRLNIVEYFISQSDIRDIAAEHIKVIGDLERLASKIAVSRINPREVIQLKNALEAIIPLQQICAESGMPEMVRISEQLNPCRSVIERISKSLVEEPPVQIGKGTIFNPGINEELDELKSIQTKGKDYLLQLQQREAERTGIPSLKISFNNVFGYFIEVRNTHKDKVPADWIRKQTLVSAERYITQELKTYEEKILGAEERITVLESQLFEELIHFLSEYVQAFQLNANLIGQLDCLLAFAFVSAENGYSKPVVNDSDVLEIKEGRHPVIEKQLPPGNSYVANDVLLDTVEQQIMIITGPNMSGKSALLRQTALIVILAQMGCYVPAKAANIGIIDKVFTRVGASDNISSGESTFMVEMIETASILNNLSARSLVLLDEIGRGTSTYDGISIAWAIAEYIHEHPTAKSKTLFATHYHEMNEMENSFKRIKNYNVSIKELNNNIIFLRKLVRGGSEHSFGIHVAQMAGMPKSVVKRAGEILKELEDSQRSDKPQRPAPETTAKREGYQLSFFQLEDPVLKQIRDQIKNLDINTLTPLEALNKLNYIKRITGL